MLLSTFLLNTKFCTLKVVLILGILKWVKMYKYLSIFVKNTSRSLYGHFRVDGMSNVRAIWCKMLKSPISRRPTVLLDFINRPSGETDGIYEANVK